MIIVEVDQPERAQSVLAGLGRTVTRERNRIMIAPDAFSQPAQINASLVQAGIAVSHLATQNLTLEDLFLELTGPPAPDEEYTHL
jgi:hypothetical protein